MCYLRYEGKSIADYPHYRNQDKGRLHSASIDGEDDKLKEQMRTVECDRTMQVRDGRRRMFDRTERTDDMESTRMASREDDKRQFSSNKSSALQIIYLYY